MPWSALQGFSYSYSFPPCSAKDDTPEWCRAGYHIRPRKVLCDKALRICVAILVSAGSRCNRRIQARCGFVTPVLPMGRGVLCCRRSSSAATILRETRNIIWGCSYPGLRCLVCFLDRVPKKSPPSRAQDRIASKSKAARRPPLVSDSATSRLIQRPAHVDMEQRYSPIGDG